MYKKFACFVISGCLVFFLSFISLADDFEASDISKTEYGGTGLGQDDFLGSQDIFEDSHVDDKVIQDSIEVSVDSTEGFVESPRADSSENGGLLGGIEETVPEPEETLLDIPENEASDSEKSLPDASEDAPGPEESTADSSELESLIQYYQDYRDSLDRLLEYRTEADLQEGSFGSSSPAPASETAILEGSETLEMLLLYLVFALGVSGGLSASRIMWGRIR